MLSSKLLRLSFNKDVVNVFLKTDMTLEGAVIHSVHTHTHRHAGVFLAVRSIDSVPMLPLG